MFKKDVSLVQNSTISSINIADHAAISLTVKLKNTKRTSIWRLNNSLLQDKTFVERMQNIITEYIKINDTEEIDPIILWEGAKAVIRGHIIASAKKRTREAQQKRLSEQIKQLEDKHRETKSDEDWKKLKEKRTELDKLRIFEIDRLIRFTQQETYDGGPNSMKILAYKLKSQIKKAYITKLKVEQGEIITDKKETAEEFAQYSISIILGLKHF